jgi:hypothetical protein
MEAVGEVMEVCSGEEASFSHVLQLLVESLMSNESENLRYNSQFLSRLRRLMAKMLDLITSKAKGTHGHTYGRAKSFAPPRGGGANLML